MHLGSYQWLKMGYRYIPKFYLKEYRDLDLPGSPYLSCNFLSQSFFISYSIPFIGKGNSLKSWLHHPPSTNRWDYMGTTHVLHWDDSKKLVFLIVIGCGPTARWAAAARCGILAPADWTVL